MSDKFSLAPSLTKGLGYFSVRCTEFLRPESAVSSFLTVYVTSFKNVLAETSLSTKPFVPLPPRTRGQKTFDMHFLEALLALSLARPGLCAIYNNFAELPQNLTFDFVIVGGTYL